MRDHADLPIAVDRESELPLNVQVRDQLHEALLRGAVRAGERLPSSRVLARKLGVSRIVVTEAYQQLTAEGWLRGEHGSGTFVADASDLPNHPPVKSGPGAVTGASAMPVHPPEPPQEGVVDLRSGKPWVFGYDEAAWRRAWRAVGTLSLADDSTPFGLMHLRMLLVDHLRRSRAVPARVENIMITRGTGHGLDVLAATLVRSGDRVGIEEPGYRVARNIMASRGATITPIPVDDHGVLISELPDDLTVLYTTPAHQFPLGGRLPSDRRLQLIEWAARTGTVIVEDDYDAEFRYDVAPLNTLYGHAPEHVVLVGTLSKSLSPDVGLGWLIAPSELLQAVSRRREELGDRTAGPVQHAVATLLESGDLDRHLHRMRLEYARRRAVIVDLLGDRVSGDAAGLHVMLKLPADIAPLIVAEAQARGVLVETTERHHHGEPRVHGLVLGYGSASAAEVRRGCAILAEVLRGTRALNSWRE
ncbi:MULTISPECIES: PLP-dependent aminotransferase family protein [Streptacidiphilus]|uniref:PLP-dependent aminotransferase family protein n=1 Tax=Streptacidiphilus cavernicola TaxID=3342716 RepID=A0ABV6UX61_9ACTN|nr:PLP-dependent aminotransferase family protein [Streptacidiphilus jeojiense]